MKTLALALSAAALTACAHTPTNGDPTMNPTTETLARRYFAMWNAFDASAADQVLAAEVVGHVNDQMLHGVETFRERVRSLAAVYRPARFELDDIVVSGDRAVVRWTFEGTNVGALMGHAPTHKVVRVTGMNLFRVAGERIAEVWVCADDLGELQQLGIVGR